MKKLISFFNFNFLKKIDRYLLLNHTLIWNLQLPYIVFYSFISTVFLWFFIPCLFPYIFISSLLLYIYWLSKQKNYIFIAEYSLLRNNIGIEFLIYSFTTIIFFIPTILGYYGCNNFLSNDGRLLTIVIIIIFIPFQIIFMKYLGLKKYLFSLIFQVVLWKLIGIINDNTDLNGIFHFSFSVYILLIISIISFIFF